MPRAPRKFIDPKRQKMHEASLRTRRARHAEKRTIEMASRAAEGQTDFETLIAVEKERMNIRDKPGVAGGSRSPKIMVAARDNMAKAFDLMGGVPALVVWGRGNPTEFYRLWARLIPKEAENTAANLPLESLLAKLASKEEKTVAQAAWEIGMETLEDAGRAVQEEDLASLRSIN